MTLSPDTRAYPEHLEYVCRTLERALTVNGFERVLIASGVEKMQFLDDRPYPFAANPMFKWWLPLTAHPNCWIDFKPGAKPRLIYHQPADYWHLAPADPAGFWTAHFDIQIVREVEQIRALLPQDLARCAILGEADSALADLAPNNPQRLVDAVHLARTRKTTYELECLRAASRGAARAHRAAATAFRHGGSERAIHEAYLAELGIAERELPYGNIVALNQHGAVLHYQHQDHAAPAEHRALLIDAGFAVNGYAADITRTYGNGDPQFTELLEAVNTIQMQLAAAVRPNLDYRQLHLQAHLALAGVLHALDLVRMSPEAMVESGVSSVFFPHGLGHFLGLQVHDVAGFLADDQGNLIAKPAGHPHLRLTRTLQPGNVLTIEPGIYFIALLLAELRAGAHARAVNWDAIEHLARFGGVRIEDDVHVTAGAAENLTRDAFKYLAAA